ncbi:hypothetical protein [Leifsonia xyli]|uniref:hypothetical protein n=1 Tax=Leifsonia xyli TaxID=1575 RepID=UPI003D6788F7
MAGLLDADRRRKDLGGLEPADSFGPTVLVVDLVPAHAGADIPVPLEPLTVSVHVSHLGSAEVGGVVNAAWGAAGSTRPTSAGAAASAPVAAEPYRLSDPAVVTVPAPGAPARLHLWFTVEGRTIARTFIDAAPIEELNRRGSRVS